MSGPFFTFYGIPSVSSSEYAPFIYTKSTGAARNLDSGTHSFKLGLFQI